MGRPERSIIIVGALVILLVVIAVAAAVVLGSDDAGEFPPDSPEGTVQRYVNAISERDIETAYGLLSERAQSQITQDDFANALRPNIYESDNQRIRIGQVETSGDQATVQLLIDRFWGSGVDFNRTTTRLLLPLVREEGVWKIDEAITWIGLGPITVDVAAIE